MDTADGRTGTRPVALVLGASRGLGFLLAQELAERGHDLALCARSPEGLETVRPELEATGATVLTLPGDLAVRAEAESVVEAAARHFGRLDVLVANAGIIQVGPALAMTADDFAQAHDVIFWGTVHPALTAIPIMQRHGGGRIVVISSIGGKIPAPHLLPYTAAKFAVAGFAEGLRAEVARHGITVTTAVPGLMRTGSPRNAQFTGDRVAEHRWFTVGDSIPLLSIDAAAAARRIVAAGLAGRGSVVLTPAAHVAMRLHGLAPAVTTRLAAWAERLLPSDETATGPTPGHRLGEGPRWFRALTTLTRRAARRRHQHDDEIPRR